MKGVMVALRVAFSLLDEPIDFALFSGLLQIGHRAILSHGECNVAA
jgi:hypothetical protein